MNDQNFDAMNAQTAGSNQEALDEKLFSAVSMHDLESIDILIHQGANPFAPVGPVDLLETGCTWSTRIDRGCAAALCIRWPHVLEHLLPGKMTAWPVVTQATDVLGLVSRCGSAVDLAHWAVESSAPDSLKLLISRLDRSSPAAQACLRQLTLSCLGGCSNIQAKDKVLEALVLCMAAEPELERGWSHWRHFKLPSQTADHQPVLMPMTFVMGAVANRKGSACAHHPEALAALRWALIHDEPVRDGECRMGTVSEDSMLHMAATCASLDVLRVTLDAGCSLDVKDAYNMTPIEFARKCGKSESVALIESWLASQSIDRLLKKNMELA